MQLPDEAQSIQLIKFIDELKVYQEKMADSEEHRQWRVNMHKRNARRMQQMACVMELYIDGLRSGRSQGESEVSDGQF